MAKAESEYFSLKAINQVFAFDAMSKEEKKTMIRAFLLEISDKAASLRQRMPESLDHQTFVTLHSLKGTAKTFGAIRFGEASEELEQKLASGENAHWAYKVFWESFEKTTSEIKSFLGSLK